MADLETRTGTVRICLNATITATWNVDHYDYTVTGREDGVVGITSEFMCQHEGEIKIEGHELTLNDTIATTILGRDVDEHGTFVCKIDSGP